MDTTLLIGLLVIGAIAFTIFIIRSVLGIPEIIKNQQQTIQLLAKLIELKKKEMGITPPDNKTSK